MTLAELPPALQQALEQTGNADADVRIEGISNLARQLLEPGPFNERASRRLIELLADVDARVRREALQIVTTNSAVSAVDVATIRPLLSDPSALVRQCALLAIARTGGDEALEALLSALSTANEDEVEPSVEALGRLGRIEAVPIILGYLESDQPALVRVAERAIGRIGPGATDAVRPLLRAEHPRTRCAVTRILARWDSQQDQAELQRMSRDDREREVRVCAMGALGRFGDTAALDELESLLFDLQSPLRERSAQALGVAASPRAIRTLVRALTTFEPGEPGANPAQAALVSIGPAAIPLLEESITSGPPLRRALIAQTLGLLGDTSARPCLQSALMDVDPSVREAASTALEMLGSQRR